MPPGFFCLPLVFSFAMWAAIVMLNTSYWFRDNNTLRENISHDCSLSHIMGIIMILEVSWCTNLSIEGTFKVWITEKRAPCNYFPSIYIMCMYIGLSVLYHTVITAKPCTNTCLVYLNVKGCFQGVEKLTTSLNHWHLFSNYSNIYCVHSNNQVFFFSI